MGDRYEGEVERRVFLEIHPGSHRSIGYAWEVFELGRPDGYEPDGWVLLDYGWEPSEAEAHDRGLVALDYHESQTYVG